MADQNRTERATPRRRQKAREQGQVARSRDLVAGLGTMVGILLLFWQLPAFAAGWRRLLRYQLETAAAHPAQALAPWGSSFVPFRGIALAAGLSWLAAGIGGVAQGGLVFAPAALLPSLNRLSPASRLSQLFSLAAVSRMLKSLLPTAAIVALAVAI